MTAPTTRRKPKTPEDRLRALAGRLLETIEPTGDGALIRDQLPAVIEAITTGQPTDQFDQTLVAIMSGAFETYHHKLTYVKRRRGA